MTYEEACEEFGSSVPSSVERLVLTDGASYSGGQPMLESPSDDPDGEGTITFRAADGELKCIPLPLIKSLVIRHP